MSKKNKRKRQQKRKQKRALKNQRRRKDLVKQKHAEVTIHWDNLNFFDGWKSLTPLDLMEKTFQMDVEEWLDTYPRPKRDRDWFDLLNDDQYLYDWLSSTFDDCLVVWNEDTKGFTEKIPDR